MKKLHPRGMARCVCTALAALTIMGTSASAISVVKPSELNAPPSGTVVPQGEEFEYYYRVYNGKLQYRIWSMTYCRWVTDWIDYEF